MTEKVRNASILVYMVGNALTFTKLLPAELAGVQGTSEFGAAVVKTLVLACVWPFYWLAAAFLG